MLCYQNQLYVWSCQDFSCCGQLLVCEGVSQHYAESGHPLSACEIERVTIRDVIQNSITSLIWNSASFYAVLCYVNLSNIFLCSCSHYCFLLVTSLSSAQLCCLYSTLGMSLIRTEPRAGYEEFSSDDFCGGCFKLSVPVPVPVLQNLARRPQKKSALNWNKWFQLKC